MKFRYREMIYMPGYYDFNTDDRMEWYPNGIYNYNISRMIANMEEYEKDPNGSCSILNTVLKTEIQVQRAIGESGSSGNLQDHHVEAADLNRPVIYAEVAPDAYVLIDGRHRLEKAKRMGIETVSAYAFPAHVSVRYLGSENEYCDYVNYWNSKIEDNQNSNISPYCSIPSAASPALDRNLDFHFIWNYMASTLNICRRIEVYHCNGAWFTLFRLNGKLYCGEAEGHASVKCTTPFGITEESVSEAIPYFKEWNLEGTEPKAQARRRTSIRKIIRHADILMSCIRVFSEY